MMKNKPKYEIEEAIYLNASKSVADFVKSKLGQPKYQLERRDPTGRDYSMTPTKLGACDVWVLDDRFGDFFNAPNGETSATYVSGFGLAAKTYENDIFEIVDNVISDAFFDKYNMSIDDYHDDAEAQDFISEERNTVMQQIEDEEKSSINDFLAWNG
tara:strand:- start:48 stop:518 length:471 start_codon:yes stop_codon:yes gene_type:complete